MSVRTSLDPESDGDWQAFLDAMDRLTGESIAVAVEDRQGNYLAFFHGWLRGRSELDDGDDDRPRFRVETEHPAHRFDETAVLVPRFACRDLTLHGYDSIALRMDGLTVTLTLNAPLNEPV